MNVWLFYNISCHCKDGCRCGTSKGRGNDDRETECRDIREGVVQKERQKINVVSKCEETFLDIQGSKCVCVPVICWDRTSVKSGLKLPPSNTSHPSVAIRPAITGALPPTDHLFPGRSREASTSSLKRVSFKTKRLQHKDSARKKQTVRCC